jgi:hypothetical protein
MKDTNLCGENNDVVSFGMSRSREQQSSAQHSNGKGEFEHGVCLLDAKGLELLAKRRDDDALLLSFAASAAAASPPTPLSGSVTGPASSPTECM